LRASEGVPKAKKKGASASSLGGPTSRQQLSFKEAALILSVTRPCGKIGNIHCRFLYPARERSQDSKDVTLALYHPGIFSGSVLSSCRDISSMDGGELPSSKCHFLHIPTGMNQIQRLRLIY